MATSYEDIDMASAGPSVSPPAQVEKMGARAEAVQVDVSEDDVFDWEAYITNYKDANKAQRLLHIARTSPQLRREAANQAADVFQSSTLDAHSYQLALNVRNTTADGSTLPPEQRREPDGKWVQDTIANAKREGEKLDLELRNYQNNLIKESIRMANRDLADHFRRCGNLTEALACYQRTRDFCSTSEHVVEMCLSIIEVSLELQNFGNLSPYVIKAQGLLESYNPSATVSSSGRNAAWSSSSSGPGVKGASTSGADAIGALFRAGGGGGSSNSATGRSGSGPGSEAAQARLKKEVARIGTKLRVASGLGALGVDRYETAARTFLGIDPQSADSFESMASGSDIAVYTVLCSLATFSRPQLKSQVLDKVSFRVFLEQETHTKDLLDAFWACDYKRGLDLLDKWRSRYLLDIYLSAHYQAIYSLIVRRCLTQFIAPYEAVSLDRLSEAFGWSSDRTQDEVLRFVERNNATAGHNPSADHVDARLDWVDKVIYIRNPTSDERGRLFRKTLQNGQQRITTIEKLLLRMKLVQNGVVYTDTQDEEDGNSATLPTGVRAVKDGVASATLGFDED